MHDEMEPCTIASRGDSFRYLTIQRANSVPPVQRIRRPVAWMTKRKGWDVSTIKEANKIEMIRNALSPRSRRL